MLTVGGDKNGQIKSQNAEKQNCGAKLDATCISRKIGYFGQTDPEPVQKGHRSKAFSLLQNESSIRHHNGGTIGDPGGRRVSTP